VSQQGWDAWTSMSGPATGRRDAVTTGRDRPDAATGHSARPARQGKPYGGTASSGVPGNGVGWAARAASFLGGQRPGLAEQTGAHAWAATQVQEPQPQQRHCSMTQGAGLHGRSDASLAAGRPLVCRQQQATVCGAVPSHHSQPAAAAVHAAASVAARAEATAASQRGPAAGVGLASGSAAVAHPRAPVFELSSDDDEGENAAPAGGSAAGAAGAAGTAAATQPTPVSDPDELLTVSTTTKGIKLHRLAPFLADSNLTSLYPPCKSWRYRQLSFRGYCRR